MRFFPSRSTSIAAAFASFLFGAAAPAAEVEVDVELFLAVDVSRSMSPRELEIQRRGYAEAIVSNDVVSAIALGARGRVAMTYVEWAGFGSQRTVVEWTLIEGAEDAAAFASRISAHFDDALRRTSISSAIDYAAESFETNGFTGDRRVIDVSGDGPNNAGRPVAHARDDALARGIVINGLPLMTKEGLGAEWNLDDLDLYYRACVIGGPSSFVVPVTSWERFPTAVRLKLVQELAGASPSLRPATKTAKPSAAPKVLNATLQLTPRPQYDCMIGEKIWERLRDSWGFP